MYLFLLSFLVVVDKRLKRQRLICSLKKYTVDLVLKTDLLNTRAGEKG